MDILTGLNSPQKEAVMHKDGPLLILAGAGSGKTRVLTHRIAHLIQSHGVYPSNIIAITFTNKAAREMKDRVIKLLGNMSQDIWISTFHAACVRMLRRDAEKIGFGRNFVIYDTSDQLTVVKDCIKELDKDNKNFPPKTVLNYIGRAKDELIGPETYMEVNGSDYRLKNIAEIYGLYQKKLKQNNAVDFDDIIAHTIKLLEKNPPVLDYYRKKFTYILVDEYQDTNTAQYHLISLLAQKHRNLCVVGDDDQSVYGFRGANIRNILDFEKEFKVCKVIKLEQNYRSTRTILDAANEVIRNNFERKEKRLWTDKETGCKIQCFKAENEHFEAEFIAHEIKRLKLNEEINYNDIAILYRMNAQSRVIEEMLIKAGIPYGIFGGLRFYDRKEIKDVLAYLKFIANKSDNLSLKRIINVPKRGIGKTTMDKLEKLAEEKSCGIYEIISSDEYMNEFSKVSLKLKAFKELIADLDSIKEKLKVSEFINTVIEKTGILNRLESENTVEARSRIENIMEFVSVALEFEHKNQDQNFEAFLAEISLIADIDNLNEEEGSNVVLMTIHSAKGLEFPVVFMTGMEESVFPGYRSMNDEKGIEEERRLCYVGMTRAKERLYLTNAELRTLFGKTDYNMTSRFLSEIPDELLEDVELDNEDVETGSKVEINDTKSESMRNFMKKGFTLYKGGKPITIEEITEKNKVKEDNRNDVSCTDFNPGDRVLHKMFGTGTVTLVEEIDGDVRLDVNFENSGKKRLIAAYARLKKI